MCSRSRPCPTYNLRMGWWRTADAEHSVGDEPLDWLAEAVNAFVAECQSHVGREPPKGR